MRPSHFSNPFHQIECWTGTHFRRAALWEVSVYLTLPHQNGGICPNLCWQQQMLEKFQKQKDNASPDGAEEQGGLDFGGRTDPEPDPESEATQDENEMEFLDQLLAGCNTDEMMEDEDNDQVNTEADVGDVDAGTAGFTNYMNEQPSADPQLPTHDAIPNAPNCDALNNQYICVVHTNEIHHIALFFALAKDTKILQLT
jgi:hypothetical protein